MKKYLLLLPVLALASCSSNLSLPGTVNYLGTWSVTEVLSDNGATITGDTLNIKSSTATGIYTGDYIYSGRVTGTATLNTTNNTVTFSYPSSNAAETSTGTYSGASYKGSFTYYRSGSVVNTGTLILTHQ